MLGWGLENWKCGALKCLDAGGWLRLWRLFNGGVRQGRINAVRMKNNSSIRAMCQIKTTRDQIILFWTTTCERRNIAKKNKKKTKKKAGKQRQKGTNLKSNPRLRHSRLFSIHFKDRIVLSKWRLHNFKTDLPSSSTHSLHYNYPGSLTRLFFSFSQSWLVSRAASTQALIALGSPLAQ